MRARLTITHEKMTRTEQNIDITIGMIMDCLNKREPSPNFHSVDEQKQFYKWVRSEGGKTIIRLIVQRDFNQDVHFDDLYDEDNGIFGVNCIIDNLLTI